MTTDELVSQPTIKFGPNFYPCGTRQTRTFTNYSEICRIRILINLRIFHGEDARRYFTVSNAFFKSLVVL